MNSNKGLLLRKVTPYLFISPFYLFYAIVGLFPLVYGFWLGLNKQTSFTSMEFVGFANYLRLLTDERFYKSLYNVLYYLAGSLFIILPIALMTAISLNKLTIKWFKNTVSSILFSPNVTSVLVVSIVFGYLLKTEGGVFNNILKHFGLEPIRFLFSPNWAIPSIILLGTWRYVGINSLFFLAGLQNIPEDILEAAEIDGAGLWKRFQSITLPMLRPIMTFIVFQAIVGSFAIFGEPYLMAKLSGGGEAGINDSMLFPSVYIYLKAFRQAKFGYSSAISYTLSALILIVSIVQMRLFREKD